MALTKKDFKELAYIIDMATDTTNPDLISKSWLVDQLCIYLEQKNPRFDAARFRAACVGKE